MRTLAEPTASKDIEAEIVRLRGAMTEAAKALEFERAAELRDQLKIYEAAQLGLKAS